VQRCSADMKTVARARRRRVDPGGRRGEGDKESHVIERIVESRDGGA